MKHLLFIIVISWFCSCKSAVPKDILPPSKMQAVLWDLMQADEMADYYLPSDSSFKGLSKHVDYYNKVFAMHRVSKDVFTKSLKYYQDHPANLKPVLDSLQHYGQTLQQNDSLYGQHRGPIIKDSAKRKPLVKLHPK